MITVREDENEEPPWYSRHLNMLKAKSWDDAVPGEMILWSIYPDSRDTKKPVTVRAMILSISEQAAEDQDRPYPRSDILLIHVLALGQIHSIARARHEMVHSYGVSQ